MRCPHRETSMWRVYIYYVKNNKMKGESLFFSLSTSQGRGKNREWRRKREWVSGWFIESIRRWIVCVLLEETVCMYADTRGEPSGLFEAVCVVWGRLYSFQEQRLNLISNINLLFSLSLILLSFPFLIRPREYFASLNYRRLCPTPLHFIPNGYANNFSLEILFLGRWISRTGIINKNVHSVVVL